MKCTSGSATSGVVSFFFQASRPHRTLHSFPTRRSSDLIVKTFVHPKKLSSPFEGSLELLPDGGAFVGDRKSTRLNSSHQIISYAVFCLKKKNYLRYSSRSDSAFVAVSRGSTVLLVNVAS